LRENARHDKAELHVAAVKKEKKKKKKKQVSYRFNETLVEKCERMPTMIKPNIAVEKKRSS
jgi:hypothetical protein